MRALVTGATGFIGSHLVEALLARGDEVRCLARDGHHLRWLEGWTDLAIVEGDVTNIAALRRAVAGVDCVYHLAGLTRARRAQDFFRVNAEGTRHLVAACLKTGGAPPRFIYLSSLAAVGPSADASPLREEAIPQPVSAYGWSKLKGEEEVLAARGELNVTILRPPVVYGPRDRDVWRYARWVQRGLLLMAAGPLRAISLCYVDDLGRAIIASTEGKGPSGEIYHVAGEGVLTWEDVGGMLGRALGVRPRPLRIPVSVLLCLAGGLEVWGWATGQPTFFTRGKVREASGHWICDPTKARQHLGFVPRVAPDEGIPLTIEWYRSHGWI